MQKEIYLILDRKEHCVYKATTNRAKADEEVKKLNSAERIDRYRVTVMKDFATK